MIINPYRFAAAGGGGLSADPLHWWDLNTNTASSAGLLDQGTGAFSYIALNGSPALSSGGGPDGQDVIDFSGSGQNLIYSIEKTWDGGGDNYSFSGWINMDVVSPSTASMLAWRDASAHLLGIMGVQNDTNDYVFFRVYDTGGNTNFAADTGTNIATGSWFHFVGTYDGSNIRVYKNGNATPVATQAFTLTGGLEDQPMNLSIGGGGFSTSDNFRVNGKMMAVGIWDAVLTTDDISYLYNSGSGRLYADL